MDTIDSFLKPKETKCIVVFLPLQPPIPESDRHGSAKAPAAKPFIVTTQNHELLSGEGTVVYITRASDKKITISNIDNV